jgi:Flp pilus assembly protein TadG
VAEGALRGRRVNAPAPERLPRPRGRLAALRHGQRGQALVEFALVLPILLLIVIGIFDFGQALNYYNQQSQLVGLGARAAAVNRCPDGTAIGSTGGCTSIQQQLAEQYAQGDMKKKTVVCITLPNGPGAGKPVTVSSTYQFKLLGFLGGATIPITASQTERQEIAATYASGVCQS